MSVPTYVMFDDGNLYLDPSIRGSEMGGWFVVFDESEPTQFTLAMPNPELTPRAVSMLAEIMLRDVGISARIASGPRYETRAFLDRIGDVDYKRAATFDIEVLDAIPAGHLSPDSIPVQQPRGEHVVFAFGRDTGCVGVP